MAQEIHARKSEEGEVRFRVWSTVVDSYLTEELSEAEVREWALKSAVCNAIEQHFREIDSRMRRAVTNGTSSLVANTRNMNSGWDKKQK